MKITIKSDVVTFQYYTNLLHYKRNILFITFFLSIKVQLFNYLL